MKKTFALLLILSSFISCSNQFEYRTDGQVIGEDILTNVNREGVKKATSYLLHYTDGIASYSPDKVHENFIVTDQIIQVGGSYYNLDKLTKYEIRTEVDGKYLILYFDGIGE